MRYGCFPRTSGVSQVFCMDSVFQVKESSGQTARLKEALDDLSTAAQRDWWSCCNGEYSTGDTPPFQDPIAKYSKSIIYSMYICVLVDTKKSPYLCMYTYHTFAVI